MWIWLTAALASGLLYNEDGFVDLQNVDLDLVVNGRIASGTVRYRFDPDPGSYTFTAVLPEGSVATGVRANIDGDWVSAMRTLEEPANTASVAGPLAEILSGPLFSVVLPESVGATIEVEVVWQSVLAATDGRLSLQVPFDDGGLNNTDPPLQWTGRITGIGAVLGVESDVGDAAIDGLTAVFSGRGTLSDTPLWTPSWTEVPGEFDLLLQTFRAPIDPFTGEQDAAGYGLIHLVPGKPEGARVDTLTTFVLDASASMQGRAMDTAVAAATAWLRDLGPSDRFNVVPYSSQAVPFRGRSPQASPEAVENAIAFLERQRPAGLSDPADGLLTALSAIDHTVQQRSFFSCGGTTDLEGPPVRGAEIETLGDKVQTAAYIVWLTDGGATTGRTDLGEIADVIRDANAVGASVFAVGVGRDVDRQLLDRLTRENRGEVRYAAKLSDVPEAVAALQDRIRNPVLVRPTLQVPQTLRGAPLSLPDLTVGTELVYAFRYEVPGDLRLVLSGLRGQDELVERHRLSLPERDDTTPAVAMAWAQLRATDLDAQVLAGDRSGYDELVSLARDYGVSTQSVQVGFGQNASTDGDISALSSDGGAGCDTARAWAAFTPMSWVVLLVLLRRRGRTVAGSGVKVRVRSLHLSLDESG